MAMDTPKSVSAVKPDRNNGKPRSKMARWLKYMKENYDEIKIRIPKGQKKTVQAYAQAKGESVNALIWGLLQEAMGVDKTAEGDENL